MTKNMGAADRGLRIGIAVAVATLIAMHKITGVLAIVLGVFAAVFVITSLVGWCPGYAPLKFSTLRKPKS